MLYKQNHYKIHRLMRLIAGEYYTPFNVYLNVIIISLPKQLGKLILLRNNAKEYCFDVRNLHVHIHVPSRIYFCFDCKTLS